MAELNLFHFQKGDSALHKLDTRLKLILLILYSASIYKFNLYAVISISFIIIIYFFKTIRAKKYFLKEMKWAAFLLIFIFIGTLFSTEGEIIYQSIPFITKTGIISGIISAWKFLMVIFIGLLFSYTTLPENLHTAVYQIFKPIPMVNENSIASKLSLTIMFIPILMDMMNEIIEARRSRYIEGSRNPVKNIMSLVIPIISGVIIKAEETTLALEARLFTGEISPGKTIISKSDFRTIILGVIPICTALILQIIYKNI